VRRLKQLGTLGDLWVWQDPQRNPLGLPVAYDHAAWSSLLQAGATCGLQSPLIWPCSTIEALVSVQQRGSNRTPQGRRISPATSAADSRSKPAD